MEKFKGFRLFLYNSSTAGHALFDSLILVFFLNFLLPPQEKIASGELLKYIPDNLWGFIPTIGFIMLIGRVVDALSDPLVASYSDRSRSRFGRRKIFLIVSCLPLALSTVLIFFPPIAELSFINILYLSTLFSLFFLFYTMYVAPYIALIPELAHNEHDRITMATSQGYFALLGGAIAMIGGPLLIGVLHKEYSLTSSYQLMIIILSTIGFLFLIASVLAVNERRFTNSVPSSMNLHDSIKQTLSNKPFILFLISYMSGWFIFNILRSSAVHVGITMMHLSIEESGLNNVILFVVAGIAFFFVMLLTNRIGKKNLMGIGLLLFALFSFLLSLTGIIPLNPNIYGKICWALLGIPTAIFLVLPNVFISELCDLDFKKTGQNRQGMYFGVNGLFLKFNLGISTLITSALYIFFGKDIANPFGVRLSLVTGALIALFGVYILSKYPKNISINDTNK